MNIRSIIDSRNAKPSAGCKFGRGAGISSLGSSWWSSCKLSSGNLSLNINEKLCNTAQATTIVVEQISLFVNPLDKQGNLRFQTP